MIVEVVLAHDTLSLLQLHKDCAGRFRAQQALENTLRERSHNRELFVILHSKTSASNNSIGSWFPNSNRFSYTISMAGIVFCESELDKVGISIPKHD